MVASSGLVWVGCADHPTTPASEGAATCGAQSTFDRTNFINSAHVDNKWLPLVPGTQFVLDGKANWGAGVQPHRVVFTVTSLTKVIKGVRTVVLWDRDIENGVLLEAELAFHAQDRFGNVWNLGEYPEEYENKQFVGAPYTWFAGLAGAEAGIIAPGEARVATRYLQGWSPDISFLDCGSVFKIGGSTCVPTGCYDNLLEVDEFSPLEPGSGHQRKYYAPGVGNIRIGAIGDPEAETLVLTALIHLSPRALAEADREALQLEKHAYKTNNELYRLTEPSR
jgi:hypothetical protein